MLIPPLQFQNLAYLLEQQQQFVPRYCTRPQTQHQVYTQNQTQVPSVIQDSTYIFNQTTPITNWVINHNLAQFPSVTVVDTSGYVVLAQVQYINSNRIEVTFSQAFAGTAYLNI